MNKSSVPGDRLVEEHAQYCGGSSIISSERASIGKPFEPGSLEMAHYLLKALTERLGELENHAEWAEKAINRDGERLSRLESIHAPVYSNSREYYEQKIEELSGKWQAAEDRARMFADKCDKLIARSQQLQVSVDYLGSTVNGQADTISELREQLAEKNRELECARIEFRHQAQEVRATELMKADAKLGALVRQMPEGHELSSLSRWYYGHANRLDLKRSGSTPEEAMEAWRKENE